MKKKYLPIIIVPVLIYLLSAFMAWEFNPGKWDILGRILCGGIMGFATAACWATVTDAEND